MRIITGKLRGLKLSAPAGLDVRPTSDRVKESVFSILSDRFFDAKVLDLFGGSGNLSLEAYSRGAKEVLCIDNDHTSLKCIKANIDKARASEQVKIYRNDALKSISLLANKGNSYDIIFCDPPYNKNLVQKVLEQVKKYDNILSKDGIIVTEHSQHEKFFLPEGFTQFRQEKYGETFVSFIKVND